jgi:D-serine deaminase-like pyridoxal phosphate-dependent protein
VLRSDLPALTAISTPALIIDQVALDGNITRMAKTAMRRGVALRPHAKPTPATTSSMRGVRLPRR